MTESGSEVMCRLSFERLRAFLDRPEPVACPMFFGRVVWWMNCYAKEIAGDSDVRTALLACGAASSLSDSMRAVRKGSVQMNGAKVASAGLQVKWIFPGFCVLKRGKRHFLVLKKLEG